MRACLISPILILSICSFTNAAQPTSVLVCDKNYPVIIIANPISAAKDQTGKDAWFAALAAQQLRFRLSACDNLSISEQTTAANQSPTTRQRPTYIVQQNFEIARDGKSVNSLIEIAPANAATEAKSLEQNILLDSVSIEIDKAAKWILTNVGVNSQESLERFFKIPAIPLPHKGLKELGSLAHQFMTSQSDMSTLAREAIAITDKDTRNLLAQYIAAMAYEKARDFPAASTALKDILNVIPNHAALYVSICRCYRQNLQYNDVLMYAAAAESKAIRSNDLLLEGALAFEAMGRQQKARRVFEAVLEYDKDQPDALLFFARENTRAGKYDMACKLAQQIIAVDKNNGEAYFTLGQGLAAQEKSTEAIAALERSIELLPDNIAGHRQVGDLYFKTGDYEKAAKHYTYVIYNNQKFFAGFIKTAEAWQKAGNLQEAVGVLTRAERLFPDSLELQRSMGLLAFEQNDFASAITHLEKYVKNEKPDATVCMAMGSMYARDKKFDAALSMYAKALPQLKDRTPCNFAIASVYFDKQDYKEAISELLDILKENPTYPKVHHMLADSWFAVGTSAEALTCYKRTRELDGDDKLVQQRIADLTFSSGDMTAAETEYRRLVKLDNNNPAALYRLAIISIENSNEPQADDFLRQATALGATDDATWYRLGCGFEKAGSLGKSITAFTACLERNGRHENALKHLITVQLALGAKTNAAESLLKLFDIDNTRYSDCLARAGVLYQEDNAIAKAQELFTLFVQKGYTNPDINLRLARLEFDLQFYEKVIALLAGLDRKFLTEDDIVHILAESYYHSKKYADALPWLETMLARTPNEVTVIEMLADAYEQTGSYEQARASLTTLATLANDTRKSDIAFHIAQLFEKDNRSANALTRYRENVQRFPDDFRNYDRAVVLQLATTELSGAREMLEKMITMPAAKPSCLKTLADVCKKQNDPSAAVKHYAAYLEREPSDFDAWYNMGDIYFSKNLFEKAIATLEKATALKPADFSALTLLAHALYRSNNIEKTILIARKAHEIQPNDSDVLMLLAGCYRQTKNNEELMSALIELSVLRPGDFDMKFELGNLLLAAGKTEDGIDVLEAAAKMRPKNSEIHVILARAYESMKNNESRFAHLKLALAISDNDIEAQYEMGRFYTLVEKNDKKAEKHLTTVLQMNPAHAPTLYVYGQLRYRQADVAYAFELLQQAIKADRFVDSYHVLFARLAWELNKPEIAVEAITTALGMNSTSIEAMAFAGQVYRQTGAIDKAKDILNKAIALDPNCAECYRTLGAICFDESDYMRTTGYCKRALEIAGYDEQTALLFGKASKLGGQDDKALETFKEILAKNPNQFEAFYHLTNLYIRSDHIEDAQALVGKAKRDEKTVWHHLADGEMFEIDGNIEAAQISYSVALRLMPDIPEAHSGLGRIDLLKNDYTSAIVNFGKALARDPYNPFLMLDLARGYEGTGENQSALEIYNEVSTKFPQVAEAYYRYAQLSSHQKEYQRAVEIIEQGLSHNPRNPRLLMGLGHSLRMVGRYQESIEAYEQAAKKGGKPYLEAYMHISNIYEKQLNNAEEAQKYLNRYTKGGGEKVNINKQMAVLK